MLDTSKIKTGVEMLISIDDWVYAKGEVQYKRIWGKCKVVEAKNLLGFKPTGDTNWYMQVGTGVDTMFIAGCRIHYAQLCEKKPTSSNILCIN